MSALPHIELSELCPYCHKFRSPNDFVRIPGPGNVKRCLDCERRHLEALHALSTGQFLGQCSECGRKWEDLKSPTGEIAFHYEAGIYRPLCMECDREYVKKRKDLYGDTPWGWERY